MDSAVDKFAKNPSAHVVISGHADERGTREYNLAQGHLGASAVNDYMLARGIDGSRIKKSRMARRGHCSKAQTKRPGQKT